MHEEYFGWPSVTTIAPGFWFMLRLRLFGKKISERTGLVTAVWYAYKGKLHLTKYDSF